MNKMTYLRATICVPYICRMLLQTISEDICLHITTYLPGYDSTKLLAAYVLYNELKLNQLLYINPSWIHLLKRKNKPYSQKESSCTDIIYIGRAMVPSAPESMYELSSHKKHFSTRTRYSQKKSKRHMNKLWTKSRQSSRNEKYSLLDPDPANGRAYVDYNYSDYDSDSGYSSHDYYSYFDYDSDSDFYA